MLPSRVKMLLTAVKELTESLVISLSPFLRFREITDDALFIFSMFEESPLFIEFEAMP